ncbi:two-component sensor histidine kinase [Chryseotalea sanaruensis]|uniref:histidine kinase n=1 Tax=Chryseotalea sanaruensis TaxID=2482724 RepID=A0A401U6R3_9BACT|nr:tetratricopeptide repeat protein [Chryseotalea sanaruensis]GCC50654.1 two-component sensor histidine kinase [Chryseotalea sanaruensis]
MRFCLVLILLLPIFSGNSFAQTQASDQDSLLQALQKAQGKNLLSTLCALCDSYRAIDREKALIYCRKASALAKQLNDQAQQISVFKNLGNIKRSNDEYDSALYFFNEGLALTITNHDSTERAKAHLNIGIVYERKGQLVSSMDAYLKSLSISEDMKDSVGMANAFNSMAFVYKAQKDNKMAMSYFEKALAIRKTLGLKEAVAGTINNIGLIYLNTKDFLKARENFIESAAVLDTNIHKREFAMIYNNLGITFENVGDHKQAHQYYLKSLKIKQERNDKSGIASSYGNIGANLEKAGKYGEAIPYSQLSYKLAKEIGSLEMMVTATLNLSRCYKKQGNFKQAVEQLDYLGKLEDSLYRKDKSEQIAEMMARYEAEKKEKENELLRSENLIKEVQARNNLYGFSMMALLSLFVIIFSIMLWRRNERKARVNKVLTDYAERIEHTNKELEESIKEKNNLMNVVAHDLKSPLNKVKGLLELVKLDGDLNEHQKDYVDKINNVVEQGRRLIADLLAANSEHTNNLIYGQVDITLLIQNLAREYETQLADKQINLHVVNPNKKLLIESVNDHLQRIMDNLVSNAIKFSPKGKNIFIDCRMEQDYILISVKDEGPGFTEEDRKNLFKKFQRLSAQPTAGEASTGLGLTIVKQLCDQLHATIELISESGQGATFKVSIPLLHN